MYYTRVELCACHNVFTTPKADVGYIELLETCNLGDLGGDGVHRRKQDTGWRAGCSVTSICAGLVGKPCLGRAGLAVLAPNALGPHATARLGPRTLPGNATHPSEAQVARLSGSTDLSGIAQGVCPAKATTIHLTRVPTSDNKQWERHEGYSFCLSC